jgi:hypothetical protein
MGNAMAAKPPVAGNVVAPITAPTAAPSAIAAPSTIAAPTPIAIAIIGAIGGVSPAVAVAGVTVAGIISVIVIIIPIGPCRGVSIRQGRRITITIGRRSSIGVAIGHRRGITRPTATATRAIAVTIAPATGKGRRGE